VLVVEDNEVERDAVVELLGYDDIDIATAGSGDAALAAMRRQPPDCVVLDLRLLEGSGLDVLRRVHPDAPDIIFAVLTNHADSQYRRLCLAAGASYFYDKSTDVAQVRDLLAWLALKPRTH